MSAHGFQVYDRSGALLFSSQDSTYTLLGVYVAPANTSVRFSGVPIMNDRIVTRHMVGELTGDSEGYVHSYTLSGSVLSASPPSSTNTVTTFLMVLGR